MLLRQNVRSLGGAEIAFGDRAFFRVWTFDCFYEQLYLAAMRISFEFQEVREERFALQSGEINCLAKLRWC